MSRRTVVGDLAHCREEAKKELREFDGFGYLATMLERFSQQRQEVWKGFGEADDDSAKLRYLRLAFRLEEKEIQALQALGFFQQLQRQQTLPPNPVHDLDDADLARLDALAALILAKRLQIAPEKVAALLTNPRMRMPRSLLNE